MSNNPSRRPLNTFSEQTARVVRVLSWFLLWINLTTNMPESVAQVAAPITSSGLNTQIAPVTRPDGAVQFNITGGTRPGAGVNVFHSFGEFGVPTNNIANFFNGVSFDLAGNPLPPGLPTSNILGRVTGGNASNIFGTIQTQGFGTANLFLMNPAGFLFGPNATVNVGGLVAFTSADYLKLADNVRFNAIPNAAADALLSASPVAAFGFLGSNPGAITVQGSQFSVTEGTGISIVGGNIIMQSGTLEDATVRPANLSAHGSQINLASVASPGEVQSSNFDSSANMTLGSITLSEGTVLDVSANAAGTVKILGGQLVMDQAMISADTVNATGAPVAIDIDVTDDIAISTIDGPALIARTSGSADAGEVRISSSNIDVTATGADSFLFTIIDTHTSGTGKAGTVTLSADSLSVAGDPSGITTFFIDSGTTGTAAGHGGDITITTRNVHLKDTTISTGSGVSDQLGETATGSAGNLAISADNLEMSFVGVITDALGFETQSGRGGDISINAKNITMESSFFGSFGLERGGTVAITADRFVASDSLISTETSRIAGGTLTVTGRIIELTNGSSLLSNTAGDGNAGSITVTATDHVGLLRANPTDRPSGIFSNSFGTLGSFGNSGDIVVNTPRLEMTGGGRINTSTATSGRGGNVTITANSISMSGESGDFSPEPLFSLGVIQPSGLFTLSVGGHCSGPCGNAGNISINTGSLAMGTGSQINSGTSSSGQGGNINIIARDTIAMSGTLSTGQAGGIQSRTIGTDPDAGSGGNIALTAGQSVSISNGAAVSASSTGPGDTGNIQINAGNQFTMTNSTMTTEASQASGGTIKISTTPSGTVQLTDSTISASVLDGTGGGGSVNIDPQFVLLQNSQILANADQGPGGNISITTNLLLQDANSVISASSGNPALNGTVTIQSPNDPAGGKIQPLGKSPLLATSLLNQRCAALAGGEFSSFTAAGRDSLPTEPGSWLASPLAMQSAGTGRGAEGMTLGASLAGETVLLSLRQIAPVGFLTQAFAVNWSASCQS